MIVAHSGRLAAVFSLVVLLGAPADARGPDPFLGIIGGMMAAAQIQAAQQAWAGVPEVRRYCVERALQRQNASIPDLIQNGVSPGDPRLGSVMGECSRFDPGRLRAGYSCTIRDDAGNFIQTRCNQGFALQLPGSQRILDVRGAIDVYFSGPGYQVVDVEDDRAREERLRRVAEQRALADLAALRAEVDRYLGSKSELVRREAAIVARRLADATKPGAVSSMSNVLRDRVAELGRLEARERERLAILDRIEALRDGLKRRASLLGQDWINEEQRLGDELAANSRPPAGPAPTDANAPANAPRDLGPTFDCAAPTSTGDRVICAKAETRRLDLELMQPYYLLRYLQPDKIDALKQESQDLLRQAQKSCRLDVTLPEAQYGKASGCVAELYRKQLAQWRTRVTTGATSAVREEATRRLEDHVALQAALQAAGFLAADARIDGIFGGGTRTAIRDFQAAEGMVVDGILSNAVAERLMRRSATPSAPSVDDVAARAQIAALSDLEARYLRLGTRLADAELASRKATERQARIDALRVAFAALSNSVGMPGELKAQIDRLRADMEAAANADDRGLTQLADTVAAIRGKVAESEAIHAAITPRNAFLLDGSPLDVMVLANDTGKAPSVMRSLKGDLVFQPGRTVGCSVGGLGFDLAQARLLVERLSTWGQLLRPPLARCDVTRLTTYDVVFVKREGLQKLPSSESLAYLKALDAGSLVLLLTMTEADQREVERREAALVAEIDNGIAQQTRPGNGIVLLSRPGSSTICLTTPDAKVNGETSLTPHAARLADELGNPPSYAVMDIDAAFVSAKRGQCGAILADEKGLRDVSAALRRDQISFRYLPIWLSPPESDGSRLVALAGMRLTPAEARQVSEVLTARNDYLMAGAPDEITVLVNDSGRAPTVVRNLQGELVFRPGRNSVCFAGDGALDAAKARLINDRLARWGQLVRPPLVSCDLRQPDLYDLVLVRRGSFLSASAGDVVAVLKAADAGTLTRLASITDEDVRAAERADAARISEIAAGLETGTLKGAGFILLTSPQNPALCLAVPGANEASAAAAPFIDRLGDELGRRPALQTMSVDDAFLAAKRGQCGSVLAEADGLKSMMAALRRDGVDHRLLPLWISVDELASARRQVADRLANNQRSQMAERQRQESEARVAAAKASDAAVRQASLRRKSGAAAKAFEDRLSSDIRGFAEAGAREETPQVRAFASRYPVFSSWYKAALGDLWELTSMQTTLVDFGTGNYQGRTLEVGFSETRLKLKNRPRGEYMEKCIFTGFVDDKEFAIWRLPIEADCESASGLAEAYKSGIGFESQWVVK